MGYREPDSNSRMPVTVVERRKLWKWCVKTHRVIASMILIVARVTMPMRKRDRWATELP